MSDWIEQIDIAGDRYDLKDLQTSAQATQNAQEINGIKTGNDYSLSEINTGKKWLDGRDIYKLTITGSLTVGANESVSFANISALSIDKVVKYFGVLEYNTGDFLDMNNNISRVAIRASEGSIVFTSEIARNNRPFWFTVEYIKRL